NILLSQNARGFIKNGLLGAAAFGYSMILFFRMDIIVNLIPALKSNLVFTEGCSLTEKLNQYTLFVKNCFFAPDTIYEAGFLKLAPQPVVCKAGVLILLLCIIGFCLSRKELVSKIAIFWVSFSFLLLGVVGWGSTENEMVLYSAYFFWAYCVLLYKLAEHILKYIKISHLAEVIFFVCIINLFSTNVAAMIDTIQTLQVDYPSDLGILLSFLANLL
ncbi:MAG: hypothetical protein HUJ70_12035, partial [Pseudobutyrivibrio sp.]|nr:hypothetical protein [Pseudobutyrivibrio sp.]